MHRCQFDKTKEVAVTEHDDVCKSNCIHTETVKSVNRSFPPEQKLQKLTNFFKIFGDFSRLKLIYALSKSELCVCDLAALLGLDQSTVSHQLRILKQENVVKYRKDGKVVYYSLSDDHVQEIVEKGFVHINEG